jgi:hypothetical protein
MLSARPIVEGDAVLGYCSFYKDDAQRVRGRVILPVPAR